MAEQPEERLALGTIQTGDGDESVGGLVAAVVRVHREAAGDLVGAGPEVTPRCRGRRAFRFAVEPDEILDLHRESGGEQ